MVPCQGRGTAGCCGNTAKTKSAQMALASFGRTGGTLASGRQPERQPRSHTSIEGLRCVHRRKPIRKARTIMNQYARSLLFACAAALLASDLAVAQPSPEPQTPELRRQLDELRVQIAEQTRQMNVLQTCIEDIERTKAAAPASAVDQQATVPPAITTQYVMDATTNYQTFAMDMEAAPRIDNAPLDPKFPAFFDYREHRPC